MYYVLSPDGKVESYGRATLADARRAEVAQGTTDGNGAWCVSSQAGLKDVPTALLITLYNIAASEPESHAKTITKFSDRQTAEKRVWPVIEYLAKPGATPEPVASTSEPSEEGDDMATKKGKKTRKPRAEGGAARGRKSKFEGKKIYKLVSENPRRKGTHGYKAFDILTNGMTYETYIERGGEPKHLQWDIDHKFVEVKNG
jgi:hypothetical protein